MEQKGPFTKPSKFTSARSAFSAVSVFILRGRRMGKSSLFYAGDAREVAA
jgi:hypothetical protein